MLAMLFGANAVPDARASPPAVLAPAEALFREGKRLLQAGDVAAACPKLVESLRLDRATGTLLALARCHELEGRLASARAEYLEVMTRSRRERRADRAQAARQWAQALDGRISTLTVVVPPALASVTGLRIERDGVALDVAASAAPVPVDPGLHIVRATAPGRSPWSIAISVGSARVAERRAITVPFLAPADPPALHSLSRPSAAVGQADAPADPPPRSGESASVSLLGGVAAGTTTGALGFQISGVHRSGWGAALRGAWLIAERVQSVDAEGQVALRSYALRGCGVRRLLVRRRVTAQVSPEVLLQLDRADASGLAGGRTTWRATWAIGVGGEIDWTIAGALSLAVVGSLDYGKPSWGGALEVTNRGEVLQPSTVRGLVAIGPRWAFDPW
jgi:hypothetical protein